MAQPKLLIGTPEIIFGLKPGQGNLGRQGVNFSTGGMAPVNSTDVVSFAKEGTFEVHAVVPKWESSLREFNALTTKEVKLIEAALPDRHYLISDASFNKVGVDGSNTQMYDDSKRFSSVDRAIAFSAGIVNMVLPRVRPDIVWINDWMLGPVGPVAKALGIKVVSTGHNIFTKLAHYDTLINRGIELRNFDDYTPKEWIYETDGLFDFMASEINSSDDFTTVSNGFLERLLSGGMYDVAPTVTQAIWNKFDTPHPDGRSRVHGYLNPLQNEDSVFLNSIDKNGLEATIRKRKRNATKLRKKTGLKSGGDVLVFPNRLWSGQKVPELLIDNAVDFAEKYNLRILFLANGDPAIVDNVKQIASESKGLVAYAPFDKSIEELAKQSNKVSGVMTSDYEPCGGPNINYPVEGTLMIAHAIDGLKDTVTSLDAVASTGTGFPYNDNNKAGLEYGIQQMKKFSKLNDSLRYHQHIRIAERGLRVNSAASRAKHMVQDLFLPLYEE